jgi:hypothetical protein
MANQGSTFKNVFRDFLFIMGFIIIITTIYTLWRNSNTDSLENEYFEKANFSFKGVVAGSFRYNSSSEDGRKLQPGAGPKFNIYHLRPLYSTIDDYDPRDSTLDFYCLIKKDKIYIIEWTMHENIEGSDIIEFNGKVDSTYHYKIVLREKNGKCYNDTVLYAKWRPTDIFWSVHRENLVREVLKNVPK